MHCIKCITPSVIRIPSTISLSLLLAQTNATHPDTLNMSDFSYSSTCTININNTPAENKKMLENSMWAEKQHNNQISRRFSNDTKRKYNHFTAEQDQWELHSAKLAQKISRCSDSETPVALRLAIVVINSRNRLLGLKAEVEDAVKTFKEQQARYKKSRKMHRQQLRYLAGGHELITPNSLMERDRIFREATVARSERPRPRFMSCKYITRFLGIPNCKTQ